MTTAIGKDSPASIRIRFLTEDNIESAVIREYTWCDYSHVEFLLDDGTTLGARSAGGVAIRPADYGKFTALAVFEIPMTVEQKFTILSYAQAQLGKAYDSSAIAGIALHRDWRNTDKWFCSELVAAAFETAVPLIRVPGEIDRIVPRDLLLSLRLMAAGGLVVPLTKAPDEFD